MAYRITLKKSALKDLRALPKTVLRRVDEHILALADEPRPHGCRKLKGSNDRYRVRVGDHRIIYTVNDRDRVVDIEGIPNRKDAYD